MNSNHLLASFNQAINWNAFSYSLYKILYTALSFALFYTLTAQEYAAWANVHSITFLLLLWLDFGMRKSIPRYAPVFRTNTQAHKYFMCSIIIFQCLVLMVATPIYLFLTTTIASSLHLEHHTACFRLGALLFITEGIASVTRLIYHAHFWHKQYDSIASLVCIGYVGTSLWLTRIMTGSALLSTILIIKIGATCIVNGITFILLARLYYTSTHSSKQHALNIRTTFMAFFWHSSVMWINNIIKSFSERNVLVPLFTHVFGAAHANLFKIANDAALLLYRMILKTIGSSDTALLAHAEVAHQGDQNLMPTVFRKLTTTVRALCVPVLGISIFSIGVRDQIFQSHFVFQLFFIMVIGYIIEFALSPYERILEVKRCYGLLFLSYAPYSAGMVVMIHAHHSLLTLVVGIHLLRTCSALLMVYCACAYYGDHL